MLIADVTAGELTGWIVGATGLIAALAAAVNGYMKQRADIRGAQEIATNEEYRKLIGTQQDWLVKLQIKSDAQDAEIIALHKSEQRCIRRVMRRDAWIQIASVEMRRAGLQVPAFDPDDSDDGGDE
jgi:hypothetical protein